MSFPGYSKYKDSGVEWFGEVPEHWQVLPLKHLASLKGRLGWQGLRADEYTEDGPFLVTSEHFANDKIEWYRCYHVSPERYAMAPEIQLRPDDLLMMKDGAAMGKLAYLDHLPGPACLNSHLLLFRPRAGRFFNRFLYYVLGGPSFVTYMVQERTGTTFFGISQESIGAFPLALPPTREQRQIIDFLDRETAKIDALVGEQRRLIELLKEKRQAVIAHAVTKGLNPDAPVKPSGFDWIGDIPAHWTLPPVYARYNQVLGKMLDHAKMTGEHPMRYLRNLDVRWDYINVEDLPVMDITPQERERFSVRKGDLLMVEGRELGRSAIWHGDDEVVAFQKALHRLRPLNATEHTRFFYYMMVFANSTAVFFADQSPDEIPHLTGEELRRYRFPKPPHNEQVAITEFLDQKTQKLDSLMGEAQLAINLLQERRTALISAAVTGKIDVRGLAESEAA